MEDWDSCRKVAVQQSVEQTGEIDPPVTDMHTPESVPGVYQLTQAIDGARLDFTADGRGFQKTERMEWIKSGRPVDVPDNSTPLEWKHKRCGDCGVRHSVMDSVTDNVQKVADAVAGSGENGQCAN